MTDAKASTSLPNDQGSNSTVNISGKCPDKPAGDVLPREPGVVDRSRNHRPILGDVPSSGPNRQCPNLSNGDDFDDIDDILGVAAGVFDLPQPLDDAARAQLDVAIATLPDRQLRAAFVALVHSLPQVPQQVFRMLVPASGAEDASSGLGVECAGKWCNRCWAGKRTGNSRIAVNPDE